MKTIIEKNGFQICKVDSLGYKQTESITIANKKIN